LAHAPISLNFMHEQACSKGLSVIIPKLRAAALVITLRQYRYNLKAFISIKRMPLTIIYLMTN